MRTQSGSAPRPLVILGCPAVRKSKYALSLPLPTLRGTVIINQRRAQVLLFCVRHGPRSASDSERPLWPSAGSVRSPRRALRGSTEAKRLDAGVPPPRVIIDSLLRRRGDAPGAYARLSYMHASLSGKAGHLPGPGSAGCVPRGRGAPRAALEGDRRAYGRTYCLDARATLRLPPSNIGVPSALAGACGRRAPNARPRKRAAAPVRAAAIR